MTYLTEKVFDEIPDAQIIFENTDGAMYRIKREYLDKLYEVCDEVGKSVNIPLESQVCQKIIARDVNNYINIIDDNTIKFKGCFEIDRDFHKNHSKRVVSLALAEYYVNGTNPVEFINNYSIETPINVVKDYDYEKKVPINYTNHGIFDFCIGAKMKGKNTLWKTKQENLSHFNSYTDDMKKEYILSKGWVKIGYLPNCYEKPNVTVAYQGLDLNIAFNLEINKNKYKTYEPLSKTTRYVIVKEGYKLIKRLPPLESAYVTSTDKHRLKVDINQMNIFDIPEVNDVVVEPDDRESELEVDYNAEVLNFIDDDIIKEITPNINREYYIREVYKIINKINE